MKLMILNCLPIAFEGSIVLLVVMLLRFLLRKAPKKYICFLWMVALIRLCMPTLPQGPLPAFWRTTAGVPIEETLVSQQEIISENTHSTETVYMPDSNPMQYWVENTDYFTEIDSETDKQEGDVPPENMEWDGTEKEEAEKPQSENGKSAIDLSIVFGTIWFLGAIFSVIYLMGKYIRIQFRLKEALPVGSFRGYSVKKHSIAGLPAVFGFVRPVIYVPNNFEEWGDASQREWILLHEVTHIKRKDHILKLFSMLVLCLYWWNPLVWISLKMLHSDIEMACDEGVLAGISEDRREDYAKVLLFYAVDKNTTVLPVAFGESNTENRIKNILRYKKTSAYATVFLILMVGIVAIFIVTKPKDTDSGEAGKSEETVSFVTDPDDYSTGETRETTWYSECKEYWTKRLVSEGRVKNPERELFLFEDNGDFLAVVVSENGSVALFQSRAEDNFSETVHKEISTIENRADLLPLTTLPFQQYLQDIEGEEMPGNLVTIIKERVKKYAPEQYSLLQDPVHAAEFFLPLKGEKSTFIVNDMYSGYLEYTFEDGENAYIYMWKSGDIWYPSIILDASWEKDPERRAIDLDRIEQCNLISTYLEETGADSLRQVTESAENGTILTQWYDHVDRQFVILSELEKEDTVLYGLYGGNAMVLRIRDRVIPIRMRWASTHMILPVIYCGDYDGDGDKEYALKTHGKTGTGMSGDELYIIETSPESFTISEFYEENRFQQLARISYDYNEAYHTVVVHGDSGKDVYLSIDELLHNCQEDGVPAQFEELVFGDIESFFEMDGRWYYAAEGGIKVDGRAIVQYECSMKMICPVTYSEEEGFAFGEMQFAPYYYNEQMQATENTQTERVEKVLKADLTHDGVEEEIVISVTSPGEDSNISDYTELLQSGEVCYVRVYRTEDGVYDPEQWNCTGGYCVNAALWESMALAHAHAGNGMVYLVNREGRQYLLTGSAGIWQGVFVAEYQVIQLNEDVDMPYIVEEAEITLDLNSDRVGDIESAFSIDEMVNFTEHWDEWTQSGKLLVRTDVEEKSMIAVTGRERFDAWEIWKPVEKIINEEVSLLDGAPKQVALHNMTSLREALISMKERRIYWANQRLVEGR